VPWGDRTGPAGAGPMTGRGLGYCAGYPHPGYAAPGVGGMGLGRGYGRGAGWGGRGGGWRHRNQFYATGVPGFARAGYAPYPPQGYYEPPTPEQEREALSHAAEELKTELSEIEKRLKDLEARESK